MTFFFACANRVLPRKLVAELGRKEASLPLLFHEVALPVDRPHFEFCTDRFDGGADAVDVAIQSVIADGLIAP